MVIFVVTRVFDAAFATAAAVAAAAAGARAAGVPLTSEILQHAAVAGALKSATMTFTGLVMLVPQNPALIVLMALLGTSIASNVVVVAALAQRILGSGKPRCLPPYLPACYSARNEPCLGIGVHLLTRHFSFQRQPSCSWRP